MTIKVENLCFKYLQEYILETVNFEISENEWVGFIGPNGGGKTTLLKLLLGFLRPSCGKILVKGIDPEKAESFVSFVPQKLDLDPLFPISAYEVVLMGRLRHLNMWGRYSKEDHDLANHVLEEVGLIHKKKTPFGSLSGGEMQRVLIARAIASHPKILYLDEPTANLDPYREQEILEILKRLKGKMTVIMVTHDIMAAESLLDRFFFIQKNVEEVNREKVCQHTSLSLYHPSRAKENVRCHF